MSHERNLKYFTLRNIVYRRDPINDLPTHVYDWGNFYKDGTFECYSLFRSRAKITTYKSLKWHLLVIWYLNPNLEKSGLKNIASFMCEKSNGFVTFEVSEYILKNIIYEVSMCDLDIQPKNKIRKIIFKPFCGLTKKEKLSIVGKMIGRSKQISQDDIYECMLEINDNKNKITITGLAKMLSCSTRTIYRTINNELKKEKELLNQGL